jgi:hypothetical protein
MTPIEEVSQARDRGLRGEWAWYLRSGGKELPIRDLLRAAIDAVLLFRDGFESRDETAWSAKAP